MRQRTLVPIRPELDGQGAPQARHAVPQSRVRALDIHRVEDAHVRLPPVRYVRTLDAGSLDFAAASRRTEFLKTAGIHDEPRRKYFVRTLRLDTEGTPNSVLRHAIQGLMTARRMLADSETSENHG